MPIYEYRCRHCRRLFEAIRPLDDDGSQLDCPACGERGPEKVLSVVGSVGSAASTDGGGCAPSGGFT